MGINIQPPEHKDYFCNSYVNTYGIFFRGLFHNLHANAFILFFVGLLTTELAVSLHGVGHNFTSLFISCYPVGLRADASAVLAHFFINLLLKAFLAHFPHLYLFCALLANIPAVLAHFTTSFLGFPRPIYFFFTSFTPIGFLLDSSGFLGPITTSLPLLGFVGQHSCCASPFHHIIPRASSTHLLLLYLFYSHRLFTRFFGLPWPNCHIFTSFGLCWPTFLLCQPISLHSSGFLSPFTSSLLFLLP